MFKTKFDRQRSNYFIQPYYLIHCSKVHFILLITTMEPMVIKENVHVSTVALGQKNLIAGILVGLLVYMIVIVWGNYYYTNSMINFGLSFIFQRTIKSKCWWLWFISIKTQLIYLKLNKWKLKRKLCFDKKIFGFILIDANQWSLTRG